MKNNWVIRGLVWGVFMFIITAILFPYFGITDKNEPFSKKLVIDVPLWTIAGLCFGYATQKRKAKNKAQNEQ
jgi:hypothetical protein